MTARISAELREFLQDWLDWTERGAPEGEPYSRGYGLCTNFPFFSTELARLFGKQGIGPSYPFDFWDYKERKLAKTQHLCPKRIAWVQKMLANEVVL